MYKPKLTITNKILKSIGLIEASREVIENAPLVPYYEKQFATDALARTIHHGTHIEGVGLDTLDQVKRVLEGEKIIAHERDVQEVINYRNVMKLLDDLSEKRGEYSEDDFKEIHKETVNNIIPKEKVGEYRKTQETRYRCLDSQNGRRQSQDPWNSGHSSLCNHETKNHERFGG